FDPKKKIRIRFSLMPQIVSSEVEPNTSKIIDRIKAVDAFIEEGYDVHLNFSPVIVYKDWLV
ncbi:MAG TPA: lyase, partial [Flavobacteriaceae bacterium]|nr:lyase [Flavobacteriaceae bacterium]